MTDPTPFVDGRTPLPTRTVTSRALVAYERPDGRYDCHEARGTRLGDRITVRTPFGGRGRPVDPVPTARGLARDALPGHVALGRHEALVLVSPAYETRTFVALLFGLPDPTSDDAPTAAGALVESYDPSDESWLRGWVGGFRAALAEAVTRGLDTSEATACLRSEADGFAAEGRTVHRVGSG